MTKREEKENQNAFVQAIKTLNAIAELQIETSEMLLDGKAISAADLLHEMKSALSSILNYLRKLKARELEQVEGFEGAHTVIDLVEKAVHKADQFMRKDGNKELSIRNFREYIALKTYFRKNLARDLGEGVIQQWLSKIAKGIEQKRRKIDQVEPFSKFVFANMESVQKDRNYDLFYIRKEDGTRFFSSHLLKSMKLVYDVQSKEKEQDYYDTLEVWREKECHLWAIKLHAFLGTPIQQFFSQVNRELPVVKKLSHAFMALMLASLPERKQGTASASKYLKDFNRLFEEAITAPSFHKVVKKEKGTLSEEEKLLLEIAIRISRAIMIQIPFSWELTENLEEILQIELSNSALSVQVKEIHEHIQKVEKRHLGTIIEQTLRDLEEGNCNRFAPLSKGNFPTILYTLHQDNRTVKVMRSPLPIMQSMIQKAQVAEEFFLYLLGGFYGIFETKHLMISSLDPTLWKDYARAKLLQEMEQKAPGKGHLFVVTLPKQADFYEQKGPYASIEDAETFITLFIEQFTEGGTGYVITEKLQKKLSSNWIKELLGSIHTIFFDNKKILSLFERKIIIDLAYLFIALKACDVLEPLAMSFQNFDGLDASLIDGVLLATLTAAIQGQVLSSEQKRYLLGELFLPGLFLRSRGVGTHELERGLQVLEAIENLQKRLGEKKCSQTLTGSLQNLFSKGFLQIDLQLR